MSRDIDAIAADIAKMRAGTKPMRQAAIAALEQEIAALEAKPKPVSKLITRSEKGDAMPRPADFEEAVERLCKRDAKLKKTQAMSQARAFWPDLYQKFQDEGIAQAELAKAKLPVEKRGAPEVQKFETFVDRLQVDYRLSRFDALKRAAREYPREDFAKYQHALSDED